MSEKKHIDRLFQEQFKDFEVSPKENVWENIEQELKGKKSKKAVWLPLWQKIAGAAALLAIAFLIGDFMLDSPAPQIVDSEKNILQEKPEKTNENQFPSEEIILSDPPTQTAVAAEETPQKTEVQNSAAENENAAFSEKSNTQARGKQLPVNDAPIEIISNQTQNQTPIASKNREKIKVFQQTVSPKTSGTKNQALTAVENRSGENNGKKPTVSEKMNAPLQSENERAEIAVAESPKTEAKETQRSISEENKKSLVEVAAAQKQNPLDENIQPDGAETPKWQVKPFAAPVYYDGFGNENALDPSLAQNSSKGEITFSYGVNFSYQISERLKIRSGVSQVSMASNVHDIAFVPAIKPVGLVNVSYSSEASQIEIISTAHLPDNNAANNEVFGRNPYTEGTLHQRFGFIEVPLEIEYALLDQKFGLSIIGGASTLFLNENTLAIDSENGTTNIGQMNNLNETSFSTNIGLGLDYKISKQFEVNLEPMFKYQINTFGKNSKGFQPYYFGIYTGIGFKF